VVPLVPPVLQDKLESQDPLGQLELPVAKVHLEQQVPLDHQEQREKPELQVQRVLPGPQALLDPPVPLDQLEQ
jgi:hypothetical protein